MSVDRREISDRRLEERLLERVRRATDQIGRGTMEAPVRLPIVSNDPTEIEYAHQLQEAI